jgi:CHAT domain-containing protein/tetratricopeptide (TPR) repeat protein
MGKAARNRAKRRQAEEFEQELEAAQVSIPEILGLRNTDEFLRLLERHPSLLSKAVVDHAEQLGNVPAYGPLLALVHRLLEAACLDPRAAWSVFVAERDAIEARGEELQSRQEEIESAEAIGELRRAIELIDGAFPLATEIGYGIHVCELLHQRGRLLCRLSGANRAAELEEGLEALEAALQVAVRGEQAARILMHRGLAYGERVKGDPRQNIERAVSSMREALAQLGDSEDGELRAMMETNLSVALIRSGGDRLVDARAAVSLCYSALAYRSPERDPENWAYTQINLAYGLQTIAELGEGDADDARTAYQAVLDHGHEINDRALIGGAHHGLGRLALRSTNHSPEQMAEAHEAGQLDELFDTRVALQSARDHLTAALQLTPKDPDPLRYARILDDLSHVLQELGNEDEALDRAQEGLDLVSPTSAPVVCKNLAGRVGWILASNEDWRSAGASFKLALAAAEITINARIDGGGLADELRSTGNLHRWAAYAFAQSGDLRAAVAAIDSGRARELHLRLGPSDEELRIIEGIPRELRLEYEAAQAEFAAAPIDATDSMASRRLGEATAAIRELPALAGFRTGVSWDTIEAAVEPECPLVYVNPTPFGTVLLMLARDPEGYIATEARFVATTSTEVLMHTIVSGGQLDQDRPTKSYMIAASGQGDDHDVAGALDELLPWLSATVGTPLLEYLIETDAVGMTLVPCGALEMAPLHALPLSEEATVMDRFEVRYAPSAAVCAAALGRARVTAATTLHFVAVADPDGSLPAAGPEVKEIAAIFGDDNSVCANGSVATLEFLAQHAGEASHLHFSCHARSGIFDAGEAAISLASGPLAATALTTFGPLKTRLTVVSACQSAQPTMAGLLQAQFSIAAALLAAGSACVIASLWPVDDLATALLMTRLYQELLIGDKTPPGALRAAQLWLRRLSDKDEQEFFDRHPGLAAEYARRVAEGNVPGRRGGQLSLQSLGQRPPYEHPDYWGAFIAIGA